MSGSVLVLAALLSSPALWAGAVTGEMPLEVALTRYLWVTGSVWVLLSLASGLVRPAPAASPDPLTVAEADEPV